MKGMISTLWRRIALGTVLWIVFWPTLWFIRTGEITGPKAWFWIIGELNYPFALLVYYSADSFVRKFNPQPFVAFFSGVAAVVLFMLLFYPRGGFSFGVLAEAVLF